MNHPRFWAKTGKGAFSNGQPEYHSVICHLADTAAVAMEIVRTYLSPSAISSLERGLDLQGESLIKCCGFLAGSHDLGKVSPAFQFQVNTVAQALVGETIYDLWHLPENDAWRTSKAPHGLVTAKTLPGFLVERRMDELLARKLAAIVGGHHGFFPSTQDIIDLKEVPAGTKENDPWRQFSRGVFEQLEDFVEMTAADWPNQCDNAGAMLLAGLTTVSDWIASNPDKINGFPYADNQSFSEYKKKLPDRAKRALKAIGWMHLEAGNPLSFRELFSHIETTRALQDKAIELTETLSIPCFILAEASMGEGKTEVAFFLADHFQQALGAGGFYIGLPTQATSNAMYDRVKDFLTRRYPEEEFPDIINLTLSHSAAVLKNDYQASVCRLDLETQVYDQDTRVAPREWHTARKRTLLSPYGVGTVDQALMGVIRSKHQFVRLFGLAGRTVIIDEIHAYDLYTSTVIERLLEWLALLGSPVIALSATLPEETRRRLVTAYAKGFGGNEPTLLSARYPRLTVFMSPASEAVSYPFEASSHVTRLLHLRWIDRSNWIDDLRGRLSSGGCVAIICSTVRRAQTVFQQLQQTDDFLENELGLFHGRFLFVDRERIEQQCLEHFGKPSIAERPHRYVLVATQVVEQSLDLDFDLMISDIAPIDLLLQRSGRLHRHAERDGDRPNALKQPELWLVEPALDKKGQLDFQEAGYIYDRHVLLRSWLAIRHLDKIDLPEMTDTLIEAVYDPRKECGSDIESIHQADWQASLDLYKKDQQERKDKARHSVLPAARKSCKPDKFTRQGKQDDENAIAGVTRLGEPSVTVVFIVKSEHGTVLPSKKDIAINLEKPPNFDITQALLAHSTRISTRGLVDELINNEDCYKPKAWKSRMLKYCRCIELDINHVAKVDKWLICLDPLLGVVTTASTAAS